MLPEDQLKSKHIETRSGSKERSMCRLFGTWVVCEKLGTVSIVVNTAKGTLQRLKICGGE